jgi:hypothetical protein
MDAGTRPAFHEGHAAPLIQILAWLFLAFETLAVIAQFATKRAMSRRLVKAKFVLLATLVSILVVHPSKLISNTCYCRFLH